MTDLSVGRSASVMSRSATQDALLNCITSDEEPPTFPAPPAPVPAPTLPDAGKRRPLAVRGFLCRP